MEKQEELKNKIINDLLNVYEFENHNINECINWLKFVIYELEELKNKKEN